MKHPQYRIVFKTINKPNGGYLVTRMYFIQKSEPKFLWFGVNWVYVPFVGPFYELAKAREYIELQISPLEVTQ